MTRPRNSSHSLRFEDILLLPFVALLAAAVYACTNQPDPLARALFKDQIPYTRILASKSGFDPDFGEKFYGCFHAAVRLEPRAPENPPTYSLQKPGGGKNYWTWKLTFGGEWRNTPLSPKPQSHMTEAAQHCLHQLPKNARARALAALSKPGSFYILDQRSYENTTLYLYSHTEQIALKFRYGE